jgi:phosphoglycerate-specific signal transduction histidine kinase
LINRLFDNKKDVLQKIEKTLKSSFNNIKEEMDIHLDSINENTSEINANFDYLLKLEGKVDKLSERIDDLHMMVEELMGMPTKSSFKDQFANINLTNREQEVFMTLYSLQTEESLSYSEIAKKLGFPISLVDKFVIEMIMKGIPIIKKYAGNTLLLSLDEEFKNLQAKENILNIHENIAQSMIN